MPKRLPLRVAHFFLRDPGLFLRYISVGAISALVEWALFTAAYQGLGWPLLLANIAALSIAILANFAGQKNWTFRIQGRVSRQFRLYILMQGISGVLNNALIYLLIACWDWYPPVAKLIQIGLVFIWNFTFCKLVVFAEKRSSLVSQA